MKQLADFTTHHLVVKGIVTEADAPIYVYGFEVMFSILFTIGSIFSLAAYLGFFVETLVFFIAFFFIKDLCWRLSCIYTSTMLFDVACNDCNILGFAHCCSYTMVFSARSCYCGCCIYLYYSLVASDS